MKVTEFRLKLYPQAFNSVRYFYEHTLELPIIKEWNRGPDDYGVMFDTGAAVIELLSLEKKYQPVSGCNISLEVPNVEKLWERLQNADTIVFSIRSNAWSDQSFCIADPEGFEITFFTKHT